MTGLLRVVWEVADSVSSWAARLVFNVPTWHSVGGRGYPHRAAPGEQTFRAQRLYMSRGRSPWPHCGRYL